ncbi:MAG: hypothetical protein R3F38_08655 [Gammaproteobacteria bacterium]
MTGWSPALQPSATSLGSIFMINGWISWPKHALNATLTRYQQEAGLANLYSVMLHDGQWVRASSWVTGDDGKPVEENWYLRPYEDAPTKSA